VIFKQEMLDKILAGEKTVTRRPVKYNESGKALPCKYQVGKTYAIQPGRGKKAMGRLQVKSIGLPAPALGLTEAEAWREGFESVGHFNAFLVGLYGNGCLRKQYRRIEFELVEVDS
jgi:hypothetical protein